MQNINPYFLIGTLGMLLTAILNITAPVIFPEAKDGLFGALAALYLVCVMFILGGTLVMINRKHPKKWVVA